MSRTQPFEDRLEARLREEDVLPSPDTYERVRPGITRLGEAEHERVRAVAGSDWDAVVSAIPSPRAEADNERVLGFGCALTAFAVAPLDCSERYRQDVVELGATANLVVATFDELVDAGVPPDRVLSRRRLRAAAADSRLLRFLATAAGFAPGRAMARLVAGYFEGLRALPHAAGRPSVVAAHRKDIARMYRAERRTLTVDADAADNRITSVYPFLVMGRPGWLATPTLPADRYREHVDWLRRLGEFVGLLDDAVDLREDGRAGAHNAVAARRAEADDAAVISEVSSLGRRVLDEWEAMTDDADLPATTREALPVCVASWLGGIPGN